jgi:anti-sigma-K factor RskA
MNLQDHPELADRLAAAYALGTLRGGARRRFEAMARRSPALRAMALTWQERFAAMTELQPTDMPSPNVWKRIENLLPREPATAPAAPAASDRVDRLLALWRRAAFAGGAAAVAVALLAVGITHELQQRNEALVAKLQSQPSVEYVAVLSDQQQSPSLLVTFDPTHQQLTLKRVGAVSTPPDRSLQLWSVVPGAAPRSLGLVGDEPVTKRAAAMPDLQDKPLLAVSLEPRGGAPAGSGPTGPVLFKGPLLQASL